MTDQTKIVALAYDMGTLIKATKQYAYISDIRLRFDDEGHVIQVSKLIPKTNHLWRKVECTD